MIGVFQFISTLQGPMTGGIRFGIRSNVHIISRDPDSAKSHRKSCCLDLTILRTRHLRNTERERVETANIDPHGSQNTECVKPTGTGPQVGVR